MLGSVQDAGFPQVGCYTARCDAGRALMDTGRGRFVSSLALVEPAAERFYLVDATPDITRQLDLITEPAFRRRAAERRPFDGIFLTHAHIGHYAGLAMLGREGMGMQETPVYCSPAMAGFLASNFPWRLLVDQGHVALRPLALDVWHRIDPFLEVQLWKVPHRDELADTVGFVFRGPDRLHPFPARHQRLVGSGIVRISPRRWRAWTWRCSMAPSGRWTSSRAARRTTCRTR